MNPSASSPLPKWLERIREPRDLRGLSVEDLRAVGEEIREAILRVTATNGGHLASSLGTVELTLALHYVFETPRDRLIWDVGHQAYAHKLVTGRAGRFDTIRQEGGLSGFLRREESPYDAFGAGHASTSISAAVGMAIARDRLGETNKVVAVTGDGALTGGMCYEALNHAGAVGTDLLVVLNDNEMSISPNVGALARTFNRVVMTNLYNQRRRDIMDLIRRLPAGERVLKMSHRVEETVKGMILPGIFFEELGLRYLGPIDGHNLDELIPVLQKIRTLRGPIVLHVITKKGRGRPYAEADPIRWHSPPLHFDAESGQAPDKKAATPSYSAVLVSTLCEEARRDSRIVAVTAAMLEGTGLSAFQQEFPDRTLDVGIAEEHAVTCAAGMACDGLRPFVCIYSSFLQRAIDQIIHDVALQNLPVVIGVDRGGLVGDDGPTHHGVFDLTYLRMIPNLIVMAPMDGAELRAMTHAAALYEGGPVALRYPRGNVESGFDPAAAPLPIAIGKGRILRQGEGVCLVGIGAMTGHALAAADLLAAEGTRVTVADARFVKPLDRELLLEAARRHEWLVTVEDNALAGGFGSAVMELFAQEGVEARVLPLGIPDRFIEHGKPASLYQHCGLSPESIADRVRELMGSLVHIQQVSESVS